YNHPESFVAPPAVFTAADGHACAVLSERSGGVSVFDITASGMRRDPKGNPLRIDTGGYAQRDLIAGGIQAPEIAQAVMLDWRTGTTVFVNLGIPMKAD